MAWIFQTDGNYVNFNGGGNLWRLHKDSNCISWHWDETGDLFFDVYDQEYTVKAGNIADVVIDGVPLSAASGFPAAIQAAFTGLSVALPYLTYRVGVEQTGTNAPTGENIFQDNIEGAWSYADVGTYHYTKTGFFTPAKIFIPHYLGNGAVEDVNGIRIKLSRLNDNVLELTVKEAGVAANDFLANTSIEFYVY